MSTTKLPLIPATAAFLPRAGVHHARGAASGIRGTVRFGFSDTTRTDDGNSSSIYNITSTPRASPSVRDRFHDTLRRPHHGQFRLRSRGNDSGTSQEGVGALALISSSSSLRWLVTNSSQVTSACAARKQRGTVSQNAAASSGLMDRISFRPIRCRRRPIRTTFLGWSHQSRYASRVSQR